METPKVFASYSHDSNDHKQWVLKLCTKLRENGVDVMLDQWDIRLGTDQTLFMEKLSTADRVLVICTDNYVHKANDREGGAGYEATIITAEIADDLKTEKFIPVIRQSSNGQKAPIFLETRRYIDFRDDSEFDEKFNELLHDIHDVPIIPKPELGENPFSKQSPALETSSQRLREIPEQVESAVNAYKEAEAFIAVDNRFGWQQLVKRIRRDVSNSLEEWRPEFEQQGLDSTEKILEVVDKAVGIVSPLISVPLAAVESGEENFSDQKSVLRDLFTIVEWKNSTYTAWRDMPNVLRYVYQGLHGAISLRTDQLNLALSLAQEKVRSTHPKSMSKVWETPSLIGHYYFNVEAKDLWKHLATAYERWEWLDLIFRDKSEYRASLVAYYMALNIHELATKINSEYQEDLDNYRFKVPLDFLFEKYEKKGRAVDMLLTNSTLPELWTCLGVTQEQMKNSWKSWIYRCKHQFLNNYPRIYFENSGIHLEHENFFDNL